MEKKRHNREMPRTKNTARIQETKEVDRDRDRAEDEESGTVGFSVVGVFSWSGRERKIMGELSCNDCHVCTPVKFEVDEVLSTLIILGDHIAYDPGFKIKKPVGYTYRCKQCKKRFQTQD